MQRELTTVGEAKALLHEAWGVPPGGVELVHCGRKLYPDDALLCDRGILEGSTVYVRERSAGVD